MSGAAEGCGQAERGDLLPPQALLFPGRGRSPGAMPGTGLFGAAPSPPSPSSLVPIPSQAGGEERSLSGLGFGGLVFFLLTFSKGKLVCVCVPFVMVTSHPACFNDWILDGS